MGKPMRKVAIIGGATTRMKARRGRTAIAVTRRPNGCVSPEKER